VTFYDRRHPTWLVEGDETPERHRLRLAVMVLPGGIQIEDELVCDFPFSKTLCEQLTVQEARELAAALLAACARSARLKREAGAA
jgi:hypothetical protein